MSDFDFTVDLLLGASAYRAAEVGEVRSTVSRVKHGSYESWCREWRATAEAVEQIARRAEAGGHRISAHEAYLRASSYWFAAAFYVLGTKSGGEGDLYGLWRRHRDCFEIAARLAQPAWERIEIPYEDTRLEGWLFRGAPAGERAPLAILNNGSDGTVTDMWVQGGAAGTARGYNCLAFDGPGQGEALYEQGLQFRRDWEAVIGPVVDWALARDDVDPDRIALLGVSQGGYWVPRALAFEHRVAAGVADPGVIDVGATMRSHLPGSMVKLLDAGKADRFDSEIHTTERFSRSVRFTMKFRALPYGTDSAYEMFSAADSYRIDEETAASIQCPLLITNPENEQFWPGQSTQLARWMGRRATLVRFTAEEGADGHCEPKAPVLRNQRVFDWLDDRLQEAAGPADVSQGSVPAGTGR